MLIYSSVKDFLVTYKVIGIFNNKTHNIINDEILYGINNDKIKPIATETEKQLANR